MGCLEVNIMKRKAKRRSDTTQFILVHFFVFAKLNTTHVRIAIREARLVASAECCCSCGRVILQNAYPAMLQLHALRDIECALSRAQQQSSTPFLRRRLRITTYDMSRQELIAHSRVLRRICGENDIEGQSWIQAAELARKCRRFQYASKALLNASAYASSSKSFAIKLRIERAELLYVVFEREAREIISIISITSLTNCVAPKVLEHNNSLVSLYLIIHPRTSTVPLLNPPHTNTGTIRVKFVALDWNSSFVCHPDAVENKT